MVTTGFGAHARVALLWVSIVGCGVDVRVADDDGAGASSEGAGWAVGGAGGGSGEGGQTAYDLQAGCSAMCDQPCVGSKTLCTEDCVEAAGWALGCERDAVEWYGCTMDYCVGAQDCTELESNIVGCLNRGGCEDPVDGSFQLLCEAPSSYACDDNGCEELNSCGCSAPCYDGHSASVSCDIDWEDFSETSTPRHDCRCFFDGEFVGECSTYSINACLVEYSCCSGWFAAD
jgi:hypothetical protein